MAMIPTMTASTPIKINEVDDDLSTDVGRVVDVDVDMASGPFARFGLHPGPVASPIAPSWGADGDRGIAPMWVSAERLAVSRLRRRLGAGQTGGRCLVSRPSSG